ncbi:UDP-glucose/GDP-mannose dehydrogenase family protein [Actinoplanes sp. Pm04-4]|uniref:UDP-glucose 6-dehydrogenase n=1 Tax=Paractinoplanes pyxinae TaxID=2997416 RepID=A0ABT4BCA2_9ACTN|nr:UDP-glucose/GDP-mannose dehydrogenase family protein [Actinoplanes pyxinae]MCY1144106.1 UDP-glucose/GDP-mannose dehydrogenase family protein [Actinoplanes pyxinae]
MTLPIHSRAVGTGTFPSGTTRPRLTFIGTGYLGATYAICFAELGYEVLGVDVDTDKIENLRSGVVPFHEPGLDEVLHRNLDSGRLGFTTDFAEAAAFGDVHFICVGTPQGPEGVADLRYVEAAVTSLVPHLDRKVMLVGKSTVPVGTTEWIRDLCRRFAPTDVAVEVAWSPEFLQEGHAVEDVLRPDRVVFGASSDWAIDALYAAHKGVFDLAMNEDREVPVVITDVATAELVKVASNAFLATKISFINAMATMCDAAGADVAQLARAMGYDERIGSKFLRAGVGFGGGCLPKDIRAFAARAEQLGVTDLRFLGEIDAINRRRRTRVVELAAALLGCDVSRPTQPDLSGRRIAVLGAAFKPNTDDVRDSPALAVASLLQGCGADLRVYDPAGLQNAQAAAPHLTYAKSLEDAARDADLVCVLTAWDEFRNVEPAALAGVVRQTRIIDAMNCLDPAEWIGVGWTYRGLGRYGSPTEPELR